MDSESFQLAKLQEFLKSSSPGLVKGLFQPMPAANLEIRAVPKSLYTLQVYLSDMKAYSEDLREQVLAARQAGATQVAVASQFSVSVSFVAKLACRQRTHGSVAALPPVVDPPPA